jgi:putative PIN family toxin of toxin-antitoxin system
MRVVADTNVLISALLIETSQPAKLIAMWRQGKFDLLTAAQQLDELMRVTRYPKIRERLKPALAGRLINELRDLAVTVRNLPTVDASPDPYDNHLLSIAVGGAADFLVTGDKRDLLALKKHQGIPIVSVSRFLQAQPGL